MQFRIENPEVLYTKGVYTTTDLYDVNLIKKLSLKNARKRIRICAHANPNECLHEMIIVHERNTFVRPHKHLNKTESVHIIEGEVDIVVFDDIGNIERVIQMGEYSSGKIFFYRMDNPEYHTLIIRSNFLVFHETTSGPFNTKDTIFPEWGPNSDDLITVNNYIKIIDEKIIQKLRKERKKK
jgi:cupin fold WbuC family metalloprotein